MTKKNTKSQKPGNEKVEVNKDKKRILQTEIPFYSSKESLRIGEAIVDSFGGKPTSPIMLAQSLSMLPAGSNFRMLTGAAAAYGITTGAYNSESIGLTELGHRILKPTDDKMSHGVKIEALLRPRVIREFLQWYNKHSLPVEKIALNVLEELGVPPDKAKNCFEIIEEGGNYALVFQNIKDKKFVHLENISLTTDEPTLDEISEEHFTESEASVLEKTMSDSLDTMSNLDNKLRKVFITHGKNRTFLDPLKELLSFGELEAVVSVEKQSVAQPVPEKVMTDMRTCGAAIIHVENEKILIDNEGNKHNVLNPNVLIEIGAAMALFGDRFILLVKDGVSLPSNLQGLYRVQYSDDKLDGDATIRILKTIKDIKNHALPK